MPHEASLERVLSAHRTPIISFFCDEDLFSPLRLGPNYPRHFSWYVSELGLSWSHFKRDSMPTLVIFPEWSKLSFLPFGHDSMTLNWVLFIQNRNIFLANSALNWVLNPNISLAARTEREERTISLKKDFFFTSALSLLCHSILVATYALAGLRHWRNVPVMDFLPPQMHPSA